MWRNWYLAYDGEGEEGGGEGGGSGSATLPATLNDYLQANPKAQDELNNMMASNRKKLTVQNQQLINQLEQLKEQTNITSQQKEELEERIEQLSNQYLTQEQIAKKEADKAFKKYQQEKQSIEQERDSWKTRYTESTIKRELLDASISVKAINPDVMVDMLSGKTYLGQKLGDDGQPTGDHEVRVKFQDTDENNNPVTVELSPDAALKRMLELPDKYGHLFQSTATSGMGANNSMGGGAPKASLQTIMKDPVKYAEWRKQNPDLDLSKLR